MSAEELQQVADVLNKLDFVRWDRFIQVDGGDLDIYGWIDRDDGRADFVNLVFPSPFDPMYVGFTTSSAARSSRIGELLHGEGSEHFDCQRIDEHFGDLVHNKTKAAS